MGRIYIYTKLSAALLSAITSFGLRQWRRNQREYRDYSWWAAGLKKHKRPLTASQ
ncbi:Hypothetical protein FKW44_009001 [Caligus rogercresseyi]|uniref:Uncharacterized protein n=1 Tax=Caligus rogercresseyi TaxID=217165 RepID=A0A7T8HER5_CALRO|nr:Hypothetical protein FKW44_009001 [Caligus rogercresseyi]